MEVIHQNESFEIIFDKFKDLLGNNAMGYRGHCYRVLNYMHYLKLSEQDMEIVAVAIPFHDIGVWSHNTMDYLEVSFLEARKYIRMNKLTVDEEQIETLILDHHTIRSLKDRDLAEKMRKADLVDLSFGLIHFNIPSTFIRSVHKSFPYQGFQKNIYGKVIRYAFQNPKKPFPMLKF